MKILDRYIIRQFLINFMILTAVVMLLFVMVDVMIDLDNFLEAGHLRAQKYGGSALWWTLWSIGDYYGPFLLFLYVYVSGLLVVGAMGFTYAGLSRSGELVTMICGGISLFRIAAPVLVVGCIINGLTLLDQELVVPRLSHKLARLKSQVNLDAVRTFAVYFAPDARGNLVSAATFDAQKQELEKVTILERDQRGMAIRRLTASRAHWNGRLGQWDLIDGRAVRRAPPGKRSAGWADLEAKPAAAFKTELSPEVLMARRAAIYPALLSMKELGGLMTNPAADESIILRIMHGRFSLMVVNVLILVVGLPYFLRREPYSPLAQAVKASVGCIGLWMTGVSMLSFGVGPLNPVVSAWLPVVILLPVSAWMLQRVRT